eukprot:gene35860-46550_t
MGPPGNIHVSEGYHPQWDVDSDDDDGNTRVEKGQPVDATIVAHCRKAHPGQQAYQSRVDSVPLICWEDLAVLACDNRERLKAESVALNSSLQTTQAVLEDERGARLLWETRKKELLLEMEELQVNVTLTQRRESDLEGALSALRDRYAAEESKWKFEREATQRELDQAARKEHELRSELVKALEAHQPPTVGWRLELDNTRQELEATKRELLAAHRVIDSLRKEASHPAPGLREENIGTAGRGFPVFTPSPAGSAASESMSTADFGSTSHGFPSFQDLPSPPPDTGSGLGQTSTLPVPASGVSIGDEEGEVSGESAFAQKPKDRVRRSESSMGQVSPPAHQESREKLPGVTTSTEPRYHSDGVSLRDQQGYQARSHYGPGGREAAGVSLEGSSPSTVMRPPSHIHTVGHAGGSVPTQGLSGQTLLSPSRGAPDQTLAAVPALVVPGSMKKVMLESLEIVDLRKF